MDQTLLEDILDAVKRLATACEEIAKRQHQKNQEPAQTRTEFPWYKIRSRYSIRGAIRHNKPYFDGPRLFNKKLYEWPLSCEDLLEIGWQKLSEISQVGDVTIESIAHELVNLGFDIWRQGGSQQ